MATQNAAGWIFLAFQMLQTSGQWSNSGCSPWYPLVLVHFCCDSPSWDRSSPGLSMHATKAQRLHLLVPRQDNDRHKTQNLRFPGPKTLNHTHFKVRDLLPFALWNMKFKASTWACPSIGSYQVLRNIEVYSHFQPCPNIIWMVTSISIYPIDSNWKKLINSY